MANPVFCVRDLHLRKRWRNAALFITWTCRLSSHTDISTLEFATHMHVHLCRNVTARNERHTCARGDAGAAATLHITAHEEDILVCTLSIRLRERVK